MNDNVKSTKWLKLLATTAPPFVIFLWVLKADTEGLVAVFSTYHNAFNALSYFFLISPFIGVFGIIRYIHIKLIYRIALSLLYILVAGSIGLIMIGGMACTDDVIGGGHGCF